MIDLTPFEGRLSGDCSLFLDILKHNKISIKEVRCDTKDCFIENKYLYNCELTNTENGRIFCGKAHWNFIRVRVLKNKLIVDNREFIIYRG